MSWNQSDIERHEQRVAEGKAKWNAKAAGMAPSPIVEPNAVVQPVAEDAGETGYAVFRTVRYKMFRVRTVDQENWCTKHFTDTLVLARILYDDSPKWCQIELEQIKVRFSSEEHTEIEITPWP